MYHKESCRQKKTQKKPHTKLEKNKLLRLKLGDKKRMKPK